MMTISNIKQYHLLLLCGLVVSIVALSSIGCQDVNTTAEETSTIIVLDSMVLPQEILTVNTDTSNQSTFDSQSNHVETTTIDTERDIPMIDSVKEQTSEGQENTNSSLVIESNTVAKEETYSDKATAGNLPTNEIANKKRSRSGDAFSSLYYRVDFPSETYIPTHLRWKKNASNSVITTKLDTAPKPLYINELLDSSHIRLVPLITTKLRNKKKFSPVQRKQPTVIPLDILQGEAKHKKKISLQHGNPDSVARTWHIQTIREHPLINVSDVGQNSAKEQFINELSLASVHYFPQPEEYVTRAPRVSTLDVQQSSEKDKVVKELLSASKQSASNMFGKYVTIAITGVDSRMGVTQRHADANHVLKIYLDKGEIEIYSVPRGTASDAGFSTKSLNILANVRASKGRDVYLKKLAELSGVGKIDYWLEMGFSQAMGVIEMLGFKDNAASTLRVLRSRKSYSVGDYQRCYNQGQFIRQMILKHFSSSSQFISGTALRGALGLIETNLKYDVARTIIEDLTEKNFPKNDKSVVVYIRPPFKAELANLDLSNEQSINAVNKTLDKKLTSSGYIGKGKAPAYNPSEYDKKLQAIITRAQSLLKKSPSTTVNVLRRVYEQRSWIQVQDKSKRQEFCASICTILIKAYEAQGMAIEADNVQYFYEQQPEYTGAKSKSNSK